MLALLNIQEDVFVRIECDQVFNVHSPEKIYAWDD